MVYGDSCNAKGMTANLVEKSSGQATSSDHVVNVTLSQWIASDSFELSRNRAEQGGPSYLVEVENAPYVVLLT